MIFTTEVLEMNKVILIIESSKQTNKQTNNQKINKCTGLYYSLPPAQLNKEIIIIFPCVSGFIQYAL